VLYVLSQSDDVLMRKQIYGGGQLAIFVCLWHGAVLITETFRSYRSDVCLASFNVSR
jgi:hypothetical protein